MSSVVEIAAWIIIGEALIRLLLNGRRQKQHEIEAEAVKAEYQACEDKEYDENSSEVSRRIWSRRREELRMRYPQHLVKDPDSKYFAEAWKNVNSQRKREFREMLPGYIVAALVALALIAYHYWSK